MNQAGNNQIIATVGNLGLVAGGLDLFNSVGNLNVQVGQPVLFDPDTKKTLVSSDLEESSQNRFAIGIGGSTKNKMSGRADVLHILGGSDFDFCNDKFRVDYLRPCCAQAQKADLYIGCVRCDTVYPLAVYVNDPETRLGLGGLGDHEVYLQGKTSCISDCGGCVENASQFGLAQSIVDDLNMKNQGFDLEGWGNIENSRNYTGLKAVAVEKGRHIYRVCFTPGTVGTCNTCNVIDGLVSLVFTRDGVGEDSGNITVDLTGFLSSGKTELSDLVALNDYINSQVAQYKIHSNLNYTINKCCDVEFEFAGCFDTVSVTVRNAGDTADVAYTSKVFIEDPFKDDGTDTDFKVKLKDACTSCKTTDNEWAPLAMVRFYKITSSYSCGCDKIDEAFSPDQRNEIKSIQVLGDAWHRSNNFVNFVQSQEYDRGSGLQYLNDALHSQHNTGTKWFYGTMLFGQYGTPLANHQFFQAKNNVNCETTYCEIGIIARKGGDNAKVWYANGINISEIRLLIPITDTVTAAALKLIFDTLAGISRCNQAGYGCFPVATAATSAVVVPSTLEIAVGEIFSEAVATVLPSGANQAGAWTTSNAAKATVSATGDITGVATGTCTITFTSTDGSFTDTIAVTVVAAV